MKQALAPLLILLGLFSHAARAEVVRNAGSPFGVICPWSGIKDAGIKWVRCGAGCTALDWGAIHKEPDVFEWKDADNEVHGTTKNEEVDLLVILGYTPKWASSGPKGENGYPPRDLSDWSDFVYRLVSRYKERVKYWEVWNEPDIGFWQGSIEQYADLLKSACVAAKRADPECRIVLGGTAGVNIPFIQRVYENGASEYFDVMAVHPYQWGDTFNDEWFALQLRNLHELMRKWGDGHKDIWLTEFGWSTGDNGIAEEVQARLLAQGMITAHTLRDANVARYFWFCVKDWGGPGYGLLRPDGSRKPAFDAYRTVTGALEDAEYVGPLASDGLRCHRFRRNGREMLAVWSPDKERREFALPADRSWTRITYLDGKRRVLSRKTTSIEIGPEPVFILGLDRIPSPRRVRHESRRRPFNRAVWYGIRSPEGTSRLWVARGAAGGSPVKIEIHNDSETPADVTLEGRIGAFRSIAETPEPLDPGAKTVLELRFLLPASYRRGLDTLSITGRADGLGMPPTRMPARIADGPVIEFLANSNVESLYLVENEGSGGAPSVRFNGTWTYRFDLSDAKSAALDLCVGAHQANEWRVLVSRDGKEWETALRGKSNRSWHKIDLASYVGGPVFVKFAGSDQQLSELVLTTAPL